MAANKTSKVLRIVTIVYCFFYLFGFILPLIGADSGTGQISKAELITVPLAFIIFLVGTVYSFLIQKIAGIIILSWHFIVWVFSMLLWPEAGMVLVLVFPMMIVAIFMIKNWHLENADSHKSDWRVRWKLTLRIFLINYGLIYFLVVFSNIVPKLLGWNLVTTVDNLAVWSYSSFLGVSLLILFLMFIFGFIISWRSELIAGLLFVVWYVLVILLSKSYPEFANSGPSSIFGLTILVQGVLYVVLHFKLRQASQRI